jgi:Spy/CpxP family protein refolding chaperone
MEMDMKRVLMALAAGLFLATSASSQPYGPGPGMMEGFGPGGYGMGPGMMRGEGWGPGDGRGGYRMGPGMMGGYGPGGYGMGAGMMWGYGRGNFGEGLNLTAEQRTKVGAIHSELARKRWDVMGKMHELGWRSGEIDRGTTFDEQAARKAYDAMADMRKQMFEISLEERKRLDGVLSAEQREQLRRGPGGR